MNVKQLRMSLTGPENERVRGPQGLLSRRERWQNLLLRDSSLLPQSSSCLWSSGVSVSHWKSAKMSAEKGVGVPPHLPVWRTRLLFSVAGPPSPECWLHSAHSPPGQGAPATPDRPPPPEVSNWRTSHLNFLRKCTTLCSSQRATVSYTSLTSATGLQ